MEDVTMKIPHEGEALPLVPAPQCCYLVGQTARWRLAVELLLDAVGKCEVQAIGEAREDLDRALGFAQHLIREKDACRV
jgi:hypothetical protein